jgi:hypothetical protein
MLIKLNPNKHQYNSNWCLIMVVSAKREIFGRDTKLSLRKLGFIQKKIGFS